jgi:hypothetical protein
MNEKSVSLISKVLMYGIVAIGVIMIMLTLLNWDSISGNRADIDSYVGGAMWVCYIGFMIAAAIALIFGVVHFLGNIKNSKGTLVGIVGFVIIIAISYALSSDEVLRAFTTGGSNPTPSIVKWSGAGIVMVYILGLLAILAAIFSEVSRLFK